MTVQSRFSGKMTPRQFADALKLRPGTTSNVESAARQVLVAGIGLQAAAQAYGLTKQRLYKVVRELDSASERADWITRSVTLPREFMAQIDELLRQAEDFHRAKQSGALEEYG